MTEAEELDPEVLRFIQQYIDTVPHLEGLLLMWQSAGAPWSAEHLAARIYVAPVVARVILEDLMRHGMVQPQGNPPAYAFDPQWDTHRQILARVARTYSRQLTRVATLIHSKGPRSVRDFARAFKLKDGQ